MKGQVKVSGRQNEYLNDTPTSSSSNLGSYQKSYEDHPPSSHGTSIGQELQVVGKNDDTYRLFIVPLP